MAGQMGSSRASLEDVNSNMAKKKQALKKGRGLPRASVKKTRPPMPMGEVVHISASPDVRRESGTDYFFVVANGAAAAPIYSYLTPQMMRGRVASIASMWEFFKFVEMTFEYEPSVSATTNGRVTLWYDPDPVDEYSSVDLASLALTHKNVSGNVFNSFKLTLGPKDLNQSMAWFVTSPDTDNFKGDWRMGVQGQVCAIVTGGALDTEFGRIKVSWVCDFKGPSMTKGLPTSFTFSAKTYTLNTAKRAIPAAVKSVAKAAAPHVVNAVLDGVGTAVGATPIQVEAAKRIVSATVNTGAAPPDPDRLGVGVENYSLALAMVNHGTYHWCVPIMGGSYYSYVHTLTIDGSVIREYVPDGSGSSNGFCAVNAPYSLSMITSWFDIGSVVSKTGTITDISRRTIYPDAYLILFVMKYMSDGDLVADIVLNYEPWVSPTLAISPGEAPPASSSRCIMPDPIVIRGPGKSVVH